MTINKLVMISSKDVVVKNKIKSYYLLFFCSVMTHHQVSMIKLLFECLLTLNHCARKRFIFICVFMQICYENKSPTMYVLI